MHWAIYLLLWLQEQPAMGKPTYDPVTSSFALTACTHIATLTHPGVDASKFTLQWSYFSFIILFRIYHSPTIPQLICWQPSPGAWNVNKTRNESDVHCSSRHWVQVLHQLTWFLENLLATLKLACNYNLCNKILVSMVMRRAFLTYLEKKMWGDDNISEKMKFSVSFHSWTASCRLVNRLIAFCPFYTWKNWVINSPQAFLA